MTRCQIRVHFGGIFLANEVPETYILECGILAGYYDSQYPVPFFLHTSVSGWWLWLRSRRNWPLKNWEVGASDPSKTERSDAPIFQFLRGRLLLAPSWQGQEWTSQFLEGRSAPTSQFLKGQSALTSQFLRGRSLRPLSFFADHSSAAVPY